MNIVKVNLDKNPYEIIIDRDILKDAGNYTNQVLPVKNYKKAFIITDENLNDLPYIDELTNSLNNQGYSFEKIILPAGEETKSFEYYISTAEKILSSGLSRNNFLIAFGGGVIGDLTGFLASTLLRGVPFVQVPTTLLAQVDSSIGGKTAINSHAGKNLIGTFYQPKLVIIDIKTLKSLPIRDLKSGYAEVLKYSLIRDVRFFEYLEENGGKCLNKDLDVCSYLIKKSCQHKAHIVELDENETKDIRVLLNLGHTFAHVYEKASNYDSNIILHGEAVGLGIIQAFTLSEELGLCNKGDVEKVINHFKKLNLFDLGSYKKLSISKITTVEYILENMKKDKKSNNESLNFVLNKSIGESIFIRNIEKDFIKKSLLKTIY